MNWREQFDSTFADGLEEWNRPGIRKFIQTEIIEKLIEDIKAGDWSQSSVASIEAQKTLLRITWLGKETI